MAKRNCEKQSSDDQTRAMNRVAMDDFVATDFNPLKGAGGMQPIAVGTEYIFRFYESADRSPPHQVPNAPGFFLLYLLEI